MFHAHTAEEVVMLLEIKYWRKLSKMSQTEIVGHPRKTTHNLQDVACHHKTTAFMEWKGYLYGFEHHGRIS